MKAYERRMRARRRSRMIDSICEGIIQAGFLACLVFVFACIGWVASNG